MKSITDVYNSAINYLSENSCTNRGENSTLVLKNRKVFALPANMLKVKNLTPHRLLVLHFNTVLLPDFVRDRTRHTGIQKTLDLIEIF